MRAFRIIATFFLVLFVVILGLFLWTILAPGAGRMDSFAAARIKRICGFSAQCSVKVGDLFDGDWDTFYEFGAGVPQAEMNQLLGSSRVRAGDHQRTFVLVRDGAVITAEHEPFGADQPLDQEIEFEDEHHREQRIVRYGRDTFVRVTQFPTEGTARRGTFYVLKLDDQPTAEP